MAYRALQSSHVSGYDYDEKSRTMRVEFADGSMWDYLDVPKSVADGIVLATSAGTYMHKVIKPMFRAQKAR